MDTDLVHSPRLRRSPRETPAPEHLVTCSVCLRVRRGSEWIEAEQVIREIRSFELEALPQLEPAVCEVCAESIFGRRAQSAPVAA